MSHVAAGNTPAEMSPKICVARGQRVILDFELARLYGVTTARLNQQFRRNRDRFPADFAMELSAAENAVLMLQNATSKSGRGGRRRAPVAFTEHGAIMVASVLNSKRAVEMSVYVVRAFVRLRALLASNRELGRKLDLLEKSVAVLDADSRRQFKELRTLVFSLAMPPAKDQ